MGKRQDCLSIKESAELIGVSTQAVYKAMKGKLKPYVVEVDGQRMIELVGLQLVYNLSVVDNQMEEVAKQPVETTSRESMENRGKMNSDGLQPTKKKGDNQPQTVYNLYERMIADLQRQLNESMEEKEYLRGQIEVKDKEISELNGHIREMNERLDERLREAHILANQPKLESRSEATEPETVVDVPEVVKEQSERAAVEPNQKPEAKKGFFARLFS